MNRLLALQTETLEHHIVQLIAKLPAAIVVYALPSLPETPTLGGNRLAAYMTEYESLPLPLLGFFPNCCRADFTTKLLAFFNKF